MLSPHIQNQRGATLIVVLVIVVIMGLSLGIAGSTWRTIMQQTREQELLFRGNQYRHAIGSYYKMLHAGAQREFPASLENLLKDPRSLQTVRHIRKLYKDPMTGEDWVLIRDGGEVDGTVAAGDRTGRIIGVRSSSDMEPFKKDNFSEENKNFKDKEKYSQWEFVYEPSEDAASQATTPPADEVTPPMEEVTPPADEEAPPADEEAPPGEEEAPPGEEEK